jgi:hypothetical protein
MNHPDLPQSSPIPSAPLPEVRNHTQFPSQYFQMMDTGDELFHVLVSRVSYDLAHLDTTGTPTLCESQQPLVEADQFHDEPNLSALVQESDFAPFKPRCDILFAHATAYAPKGRAEKRWPVGMRVGASTKMLTVTGPREMDATLLGWSVTAPQAVHEVALRYEHAFGGTCRWPLEAESPEILLRHDANPIGCGYVPEKWLRKSHAVRLAAPQLEPHKTPFDGVAANTQDYPVIGLGAVGRWWHPRVRLAGTYDQAWKETRWPRLPHDFDRAYWNCAPQDQQIDYPAGGEDIVLAGLTPGGGEHHARIPGNPPYALIRLRSGPILPRAMHLDTLVFDMREMRLSCVYRLTVAARADVRVLEIRRRER